MNAIEVIGVRKSFNDVHALDGIDLTVEKGHIVGLLGPNGAGKTTLIKILTTLSKQDAGEVFVGGLDVRTHSKDVRKIIGLTGQYAAVDENLTGLENLDMVGRLYHMKEKEVLKRAWELLERFDLVYAAHKTLKTYSGGMRRRLDLAASLINRPSILFLDEPTTGLDPQSRLGLWQTIKELKAQGTTVLLTTQYLEEADFLAEKIFVIDHGKVIASGSAKELKSQFGGDVLELHVALVDDLTRAREIIGHLGGIEPEVDSLTGQIRMPVEGGNKVLVDAIRNLDTAGVEIADIVLRKPTLDEVFLKLTVPSTSSGQAK
jgi:ABC-2 type transport system ATP-binding protein